MIDDLKFYLLMVNIGVCFKFGSDIADGMISLVLLIFDWFKKKRDR